MDGYAEDIHSFILSEIPYTLSSSPHTSQVPLELFFGNIGSRARGKGSTRTLDVERRIPYTKKREYIQTETRI